MKKNKYFGLKKWKMREEENKRAIDNSSEKKKESKDMQAQNTLGKGDETFVFSCSPFFCCISKNCLHLWHTINKDKI